MPYINFKKNLITIIYGNQWVAKLSVFETLDNTQIITNYYDKNEFIHFFQFFQNKPFFEIKFFEIIFNV